VFELLSRRQLIVAGDIGCYTLGALPPYEAMDTCVCMGASIGVGRGLRMVLPEEQALRVVSVIGDSTFVHSGLTGIADMVYNRPPTGHVVIVLDNGTTAMTGLQEHPATGRSLTRLPTAKLSIEETCRALGVDRVEVVDPVTERGRLEATLDEMLGRRELSVLVARRSCLLVARKTRRSREPPSPAGDKREPASS
jgi:indolepyruvate ferredoxin oxidoreductase alpha subunit